jgi:alkyl hydroperoxide reductase subunit AhpC
LENILVALSRSPQSVDDVGRLVSQLQATAKGRDVLPVGWEELWESVQIARTMLENSHD